MFLDILGLTRIKEKPESLLCIGLPGFLSLVKTLIWWRGMDLNHGPSGYEPDELPDCSTPRRA